MTLGEVRIFVRLGGPSHFARVFATLAWDLPWSEALLREVNRANSSLTLARLEVVRGVVIAAADVPAEPLVDAHLARACAAVRDIAEELGAALACTPVASG